MLPDQDESTVLAHPTDEERRVLRPIGGRALEVSPRVDPSHGVLEFDETGLEEPSVAGSVGSNLDEHETGDERWRKELQMREHSTRSPHVVVSGTAKTQPCFEGELLDRVRRCVERSSSGLANV